VSTTNTNGLVTTIDGLREHVGRHLGYTEWREMTQDRVNAFAELTDDHNFIHIDVERTRTSPYGGTIAHGFLTLALLAPVTQQLLKVSDASMGVNYGLDRVRFPAPLPVGAQWRGGAELVEASEVAGGLQVKVLATIELKGTDKPAVVAECLIRAYR
jgi:acyl dehydratase